MDHLRFVFLLLIVSVTTTTFGFAIKANKPNGEKLEERRSGPDLSMHPKMAPNRKDLEDQDREKSKRKVDAGALIPGKDLTPNLLKEDDVGVIRKITIGIDNESQYQFQWKSPSIYFFSGKGGKKILTDPLHTGEALLFHAQSESVKEGVSGVLTYYIPYINSTLAVTFSKPSNDTLHLNLWNFQLFNGTEEADCEKFLLGYYSSPIRAGVSISRIVADSGYIIKGTMIADSVEAFINMKLNFYKQK